MMKWFQYSRHSLRDSNHCAEDSSIQSCDAGEGSSKDPDVQELCKGTCAYEYLKPVDGRSGYEQLLCEHACDCTSYNSDCELVQILLNYEDY